MSSVVLAPHNAQTFSRCLGLAREALGEDARIEAFWGGFNVIGRGYQMAFMAASTEENLERIEREMLVLPKRMVLEAQHGAMVLAASSRYPEKTVGLLLMLVFAVLQDFHLGDPNSPQLHWKRYRGMLRDLDPLIWDDWSPPFPCIPVIAPTWECP